MCNTDCLRFVADESKRTRSRGICCQRRSGTTTVFIAVVMSLVMWARSPEVVNVMHFQIKEKILQMVYLKCLKWCCAWNISVKGKKKMCVTVMLVLPVWTQVESLKKKKALASHLSVQFEAVVIDNRLTFGRTFPPPNSWWENTNYQNREIRTNQNFWFQWRAREQGGDGCTCSTTEIGLVTRSDQPPCRWLE